MVDPILVAFLWTPDSCGFPIDFFKRRWGLLKPLISSIINGFALETIDVKHIKFAILALIPKIRGVDRN